MQTQDEPSERRSGISGESVLNGRDEGELEKHGWEILKRRVSIGDGDALGILLAAISAYDIGREPGRYRL